MEINEKRLRLEQACSFLLLVQKKRTKEKGSLKSFLGLTFYRLPQNSLQP